MLAPLSLAAPCLGPADLWRSGRSWWGRVQTLAAFGGCPWPQTARIAADAAALRAPASVLQDASCSAERASPKSPCGCRRHGRACADHQQDRARAPDESCAAVPRYNTKAAVASQECQHQIRRQAPHASAACPRGHLHYRKNAGAAPGNAAMANRVNERFAEDYPASYKAAGGRHARGSAANETRGPDGELSCGPG